MSARSCRSKFGNNHVEPSATCPQSSMSRACDSRVTGLWDVIFEVHVCLWMCDIVGLTRVLLDLSRRLITNWRLCIRFALETQKKKFSGLASQRCHAHLAGLSKPGIVRIYCVPQHLHRTGATPHLFVEVADVGPSSFAACFMFHPQAPFSNISITPFHLPCSVAQTLQRPSTPSFSDLRLPSSTPSRTRGLGQQKGSPQ